MKPLFIGGCERSGTTMLGAMLGGHSRCLCLPESQFMDDQLAHADADGRIDSRAALSRILAHERFRLLWDLPSDPAPVQSGEIGPTLAELWTGLAQAYGRKVEQTAAEITEKQKGIEVAYYYHFRRVQALCRPDQLPLLDTVLTRMVMRNTGGDKQKDKK